MPKVDFVYKSSVRETNRTPAEEDVPIPDVSHALAPVTFSPTSEPTNPAPGKRRHWLLWVGVAATLIIVAVVIVHYSWPKPSPGKVMLVVVPFVNISDDPHQEYLADGMTEEMITQLGSLDPTHLGVIARTTAMQYKGAHKDIAQIGRELGVNYILEGSVRRDGDHIRVTGQLIQCSDQTHLWSHSFDGDLSDVLRLEGDIARAIADKIQLSLPKQVQEHLAYAVRVNPKAHLAYLEGLQALNRRTKEGFETAIRDFDRAITIDPNYALAYVGLARTYNLAPIFGVSAPAESYPQAAATATHALSLDDTLAEAHTALGFTKTHWEFDWPGAEQEFKKGIDLDPNSVDAHFFYSNCYLSPLGRHDEAIAEMKKALALDPLSVPVQSYLGRTYPGSFMN